MLILWKNIKTQKDFPWKGRACKIYTKMSNGEWKLISHTGLLNYNTQLITTILSCKYTLEIRNTISTLSIGQQI